MKYCPSCQVFLLLVPAWLIHGQSTITEEDADDVGYRDLVEWMQSHGARVDDRMGMGHDAHGIRGVVALDHIPQGVELLHCPWKLVMGSSSLDHQMQTEQDMCTVVQMLAAEYRLGEESMGWPYLKHIQLPRLPAMWQSSAVEELQNLPPAHDNQLQGRHQLWFSQNCGGGDAATLDHATTQALVAFITRASAVGMTPLYDLMNHHNGLKNAKLFLTQQGVQIRTVRDVQQGDQLYLSYGLKPSSQIFRDYGFVQPWPGLWAWHDADTKDRHVVAHFPEGIAAIYPSPEFFQDIWNQSTQTLLECQTSAAQHTRSLSPDELTRFAVAAKRLLTSLPTTLQEDQEILRQKQEEQRHEMTTDPPSPNLQLVEDVMAAIHYRMAFKQAVSEALDYSERVLRELRMMEQEL